MKLNKKYFLTVFTALAIQAVFGVNFANAICEKELRDSCRFSGNPDRCNAESQSDFKQRVKEILENRQYFTKEHIIVNIEHYTSLNRSGKYDGSTFATHASYICEFKEALRQLDSPNRADSSLQSSSDNSSSSQSSSQPSNQSNSGSSSQTSSQVSQSKQNYQAAQLAHNQANVGKGKKRNAQAEAPQCIKPNADQTHYKNGCNFPVNISYCFSADNNSGASIAAKQLLADLNCNNGQFANTELSSGEELTGDYVGLNFAAMICKAPSQPLDMYFEAPEALGRCSF